MVLQDADCVGISVRLVFGVSEKLGNTVKMVLVQLQENFLLGVSARVQTAEQLEKILALDKECRIALLGTEGACLCQGVLVYLAGSGKDELAFFGLENLDGRGSAETFGKEGSCLGFVFNRCVQVAGIVFEFDL